MLSIPSHIYDSGSESSITTRFSFNHSSQFAREIQPWRSRQEMLSTAFGRLWPRSLEMCLARWIEATTTSLLLGSAHEPSSHEIPMHETHTTTTRRWTTLLRHLVKAAFEQSCRPKWPTTFGDIGRGRFSVVRDDTRPALLRISTTANYCVHRRYFEPQRRTMKPYEAIYVLDLRLPIDRNNELWLTVKGPALDISQSPDGGGWSTAIGMQGRLRY